MTSSKMPPQDGNSTLLSLLSIYVAIDRAILADPAVGAAAEPYLPTFAAHAGWSEQLQRDLHLTGFPDLDAALDYLTGAENLSKPVLSRISFALGVLLNLPLSRTTGTDEAIAGVLDLAGPIRREHQTGYLLAALLQNQFHGWRDWPEVAALAARAGLLDPTVAALPPCRARVVRTEAGIDCVEVKTVFVDDTVEFEDVIAILDPRNWDKIGADFFCRIDPVAGLAPNGWGRLMEYASLGCGWLPPWRTALKYSKASVGTDRAVVQYDLDDSQPFPCGGDGAITVDRGWLQVDRGSSAGMSTGVTVTTSKLVHIDPLSPFLQKLLVCTSGYGQAALDMIVGGAQNPPEDAVGWAEPPEPVATGAATGSGGQPPPATSPSSTAGGLAVSMVSECLAALTRDSSALAAKWAKGALEPDDLSRFGATLGARLASDPFTFVKRLAELPKGDKP